MTAPSDPTPAETGGGSPPNAPARLGIVAIGRNEGDRLRRCLRAATAFPYPFVYVDSDSSDESPALAREFGVDVVELDPTQPMSAARGRNAGFARLLELHPDLEFVQFIDGDCELVDGWLDHAHAHLFAHPEKGAVCGRRRERDKEASPYNRLIDLEWDTPVGPTDTFGGDVLIRSEIVRALGGYNETLIAGEDPDFAARIRAAGWKIERLPEDMTIHDAALTEISQWWMRCVRGGHAYAESWMRNSGDAARNRRRILSLAFWGLGLPVLAVLLGLFASPVFLLLLLGYGLLLGRVCQHQLRRGRSFADASLQAMSVLGAKFGELYGLVIYFWRHAKKSAPELIEYK